MITEFKKQYRFLSNFYFSPFVLGYKGYKISYPTVEHYYQSQKAADRDETIRILNCKTPGEAKRIGRRVRLISVWDEVKDLVMETGVKAKFNQNLDLQKKLLETKDALLTEGNYWHDNYWGDCFCSKCSKIKGQNILGKLLMKIRKQIMKGE